MQVATGIYPNGQAVVRDSTLGAHIRAADPWAEAATTKRPFSSVAGRIGQPFVRARDTGDGTGK